MSIPFEIGSVLIGLIKSCDRAAFWVIDQPIKPTKLPCAINVFNNVMQFLLPIFAFRNVLTLLVNILLSLSCIMYSF